MLRRLFGTPRPGNERIRAKDQAERSETFGCARHATEDEALAAASGAKSAPPLYVGELPSGKKLYYEKGAMGLVLGGTGRGKFARYAEVVMTGTELIDTSMVLLDNKGQLYIGSVEWQHRQGQRIIRIDPFNLIGELVKAEPEKYPYIIEHGLAEETEYGFNPQQQLSTAGRLLYDRAAANTDACIKLEGHDLYWPHRAQGGWTGLSMLDAKLNGSASNLANVRRMLTEPIRTKKVNGADIPTQGMTHHALTGVACGDEAIASLLGGFKERSKTNDTVIGYMDAFTRWMLSGPIADDLRKQGVDFASLKKIPTTLYIILPPEFLDTHSAWLRMLFTCLLNSLYRPGGIPITIFLDEMPVLENLAALTRAYSLIRDFNCRIVGIAQDTTQLKRIYKDDAWQTFLGNCGWVLAWGPNDLATGQWLSDFIGQTTVVARNKSCGSNKGTAKGTANGTAKTKVKGETKPKDYEYSLDWLFGSGVSASDSNSDTENNSDTSSETFGEQEGFAENETGRPLYLPHQLRGMPDDEAMLLLAGLSYPVRVRLPRYDQIPACAARAGVNPYYRGKP